MKTEMSTIIEIMLAVRERNPVYYHKDTKMFDRIPYSKADNMDMYLNKLHELTLYEDFVDACGDIYIQIFDGWTEENDLCFTSG